MPDYDFITNEMNLRNRFSPQSWAQMFHTSLNSQGQMPKINASMKTTSVAAWKCIIKLDMLGVFVTNPPAAQNYKQKAD